MSEYPIKITSYGWFTTDAWIDKGDEGAIECPTFETLVELQDWFAENGGYL